MTRVLHVVVAGEVGGAERMLVDLATRSHDHAIALFTPNDELRRLFRDAGILVDDRGPVKEHAAATLARSLGPLDVGWLAAIIARREARIVHLHTFGTQVLGTRAARRTGVRVLRTEHSTRVYDDPSCWPFSRWSLRRVDLAVCISEHVRAVALAKAPWAAEKLRVVANGVDLARFVPRPPPPPHDEREPRTRFVMVGRLEPRKGIDIALRALVDVPRAELVVVGDGESRRELETLATKLGIAARVRFAGYAPDVRAAIADADVALSSARKEGLGIALIEAMALERPVVALPVGGVPEVVAEGTGWLADGTSPHALAHVMRAACADAGERRRRGERARAHALARFSLDAMIEGYARVYDELSR